MSQNSPKSQEWLSPVASAASAPFLVELLSTMMEQECTKQYACHDYLSAPQDGTTALNANDRITPVCRMKLVDWCYDIVDQCQFSRENVAIAMSIVDRFMSSSAQRDPSKSSAHHPIRKLEQYQLLVVAALYTSIKLHEQVIPSSNDFAAASHGTYSAREIEDMELRVIFGVNWNLNPPTPLQIGLCMIELMLAQVRATKDEGGLTNDSLLVDESMWNFLRDELAYQTENAVRGYYFSTCRPSTVAVVSILNAIEQACHSDCYERLAKALVSILKSFDFAPLEVLREAGERLSDLMEENDSAGNDDLSAVSSLSDGAATMRHADYAVESGHDNRSSSSPQLVIRDADFACNGGGDESSCATMYNGIGVFS